MCVTIELKEKRLMQVCEQDEYWFNTFSENKFNRFYLGRHYQIVLFQKTIWWSMSDFDDFDGKINKANGSKCWKLS